MLKPFFCSCLSAALLAGSFSACSKAPSPESQLKRDGTDVTLTQIATKAKASGGLTVDIYQVDVPTTKASGIIITVDGGKIDSKNPNNWLYDGKTVGLEPYSLQNYVVVVKKGAPLGWPKFKAEEVKAKVAAGGTIDLPIAEALKEAAAGQ